jgi:hypothetical protein
VARATVTNDRHAGSRDGPATDALRPVATPRAYIRRTLLEVSPADGEGPGILAPEAAGAVDVFRECGWDVVVLGGRDAPDSLGLDAGWRDSVEDRDPGAWLLTDDVADDRWARPLGLHTAFVGPHAEHQPAPARCDVEFRDLRTAALEILSTDVPAGRPMRG